VSVSPDALASGSSAPLPLDPVPVDALSVPVPVDALSAPVPADPLDPVTVDALDPVTVAGGRGFSRRSFLRRAPLAAVATAAAAGPAAALAATGAALADPGGAAAATSTASGTGRGIWVPASWGQYVGPKLAKASSATVTVALVGDSVCRGFYSSNLDTAGWGGIVASGLRSAYGDGGSGFKSVADSTVWMDGVDGMPSGSIAWYQSVGNLIKASGSWKASTADYLGPASVALRTPVATDTITATVRGTAVKVIWLNGGSEAMGGFSYTVDGGSPVKVDPTGVYEITMHETGGLASGDHTVTITATGATTSTETVIMGVAGEAATGCLVNQFSRYGQTTGMVDNSDTLHAGAWAGGWAYPADLVVYALGANDAHAGVPGDVWARNVRCWLEGVYDDYFGGASAGAVDGVLVLTHVGRYDTEHWVYQDYAVRARGLAEAYGLLLVDMWSIGRNSWNWWREQSGGSWWANADSPGDSGEDLIHLSDAGHAAVGNAVLAAITDNLPA
jgi:lysophospholipase L1-like esterase